MKKATSRSNHTPKPLPKVNAEFAALEDTAEMTPERVRGMICNPVYAGFGPFPSLIDEETWVRAASQAILEQGPEQFLVNMLYVLRQSFDATNAD
jgi:hypothetical protein